MKATKSKVVFELVELLLEIAANGYVDGFDERLYYFPDLAGLCV
jgi:hypothetical protein